MTGDFVGHTGRECGEHRPLGEGRAYCLDCQERCSTDDPCSSCELPMLRQQVAEADAEVLMLMDELADARDLIDDLERTVAEAAVQLRDAQALGEHPPVDAAPCYGHHIDVGGLCVRCGLVVAP